MTGLERLLQPDLALLQCNVSLLALVDLAREVGAQQSGGKLSGVGGGDAESFREEIDGLGEVFPVRLDSEWGGVLLQAEMLKELAEGVAHGDCSLTVGHVCNVPVPCLLFLLEPVPVPPPSPSLCLLSCPDSVPFFF